MVEEVVTVDLSTTLVRAVLRGPPAGERELRELAAARESDGGGAALVDLILDESGGLPWPDPAPAAQGTRDRGA